MPSSLMVKQITPQVADRTNEIIGLRRTLEAELSQQTIQIAFVPPAELGASDQAVQLSVGTGRCWITLGNWQQFAGVSKLLGEVHWDELTPVMQATVLDVAFGSLLQQLESHTGVSWEVDSVGPPNMATGDPIGLTIELNSGQERVVGQFVAEPNVLDLLAEHIRPLSPSAAWNIGDLSVPLRVVIGASFLSATQITDLAVGDVVLIESQPCPPEESGQQADEANAAADAANEAASTSEGANSHPPGGYCWIPWSLDQRWLAQITDDSLTLQRSLHVETPLGVASTDGWAFRVEFEAGQFAAPVEQARCLDAGQSIAWEANVESQIVLRTEQTIVGAGRLVQCGSRYGVQIDRLGTPPTA